MCKAESETEKIIFVHRFLHINPEKDQYGMSKHRIWTIGHSTRTMSEFIDLMKENHIETLADVRRYPGSKRLPHFNKDNLRMALHKEKISYLHIPALGGRRPAQPGSINTAWKKEAFRGYADYMQTNDFETGMSELLVAAREKNTCYMCAEAMWWSCHRALISDYLKVRGWEVLHIMGEGQVKEHPYSPAASIRHGKLTYTDPHLFE